MQTTVVLTCPNCGATSRTDRALKPASKVRCRRCRAVARVEVRNGTVELRMPPPPPPRAGTSLPPMVGVDEESARWKRRIFVSRVRERGRGGYLPFEKARGYIGAVALVAFIGLALLGGYFYFGQVHALNQATGRGAGQGGIWKARDDAARAAYQERVKKATAALEARKARDRAAGR
jgi:hypothetical protein